MNIGMILDNEFPPDSRVENEAAQLIKGGHKVYLFCLNFNNRQREENINGIRVYRYNFSKKLYNKFSPLAYTFNIYHKLLEKKISKFLSRVPVEILHIHDMVVAKSVYKANKNLDLPVVLDLHENRPEIMKTYSHINSGLGKLLISLKAWKHQESVLAKKANQVIVVTEAAKKDLVQNSRIESLNVAVFPNFIDIKKFLSYPIDKNILQKYQNDFVILYLGSTGIRRGIDTAIKSISILKKKIKNIKLVLVGTSRDDKSLKELSVDLGLEDSIVFEGWQDLETFPSYIKASSVCISPLVRNRHHDTTYANKIFQYMALGKPLVVSNSTAQADIVLKENCGLTHKASDSTDLANKILRIFQNPKLASKMGQAGLAAVEQKYNSDVASKELLEVYKKISSEDKVGQ